MPLKIPKEVGALILIGIIIFMGFVVPITLVLSNSEISNPDITFQIFLFSSLLFAGMIGTFAIYFTRYWWRGDNKYGDSFGFFNIGEKPSMPVFKRFTPLQLTFLFIILFGVAFLMANFLNSGGFTASKVLPTQQFSKGESLVFSSLLIPFSEESMCIFLTGLLAFILVIFAVKTNMKPRDFSIYYYGLIPIAIGIFAIFWHLSAYPNSTVNIMVVFIFWTLKTLLVLLTGYFMIAVVMHLLNNFFIDFTRLYSSSFVFTATIIAIISLIVLYAIIYRNRIFGKSERAS